MKIVQINCVYDFGSTGKITKDLHEGLLSYGYESVILYGRRQRAQEPFVYKICTEFEAKANNVISRFTGKPYAVTPIGTANLLRCLKNEKPDVVHLQCINGFFVNIYSLLNYLKKENIPTVLTLHAEFMYTGNCGHALECEKWKTGCGRCPDIRRAIGSRIFDTTPWNWEKMRTAFDGFDNLVICPVSDWVKERAEQSPILNHYTMVTVLNGIDTTSFQYSEEAAADFRKKYNLADKKIILHVTANYQLDLKGGKYITALSNRLDPNQYTVVVVDGNNNPFPEDFRGVYIGRVSSQQVLAGIYSAAYMTVITSKRETYSMICAESLCCGTPIIGFKAGAPERISIPQYSAFFEYGDLNGIIEYIKSSKITSHEEISEAAQKQYSKEKMVKQYIKLYRSAVSHAYE